MQTFEQVKFSQSYPELRLEKAINGIIIHPEKESRKTLSPSGLNCQRAAAFKLMGLVMRGEEETYESNLAAEMGSFIHARIQKFLSKSDIWVNVEDFIAEHPELGITLNPEQKNPGEISLLFSGKRDGIEVPPFSFQCDGIVKIDGEYYIVEIKSETETAWEKRTAPNPKHSEQATGYSFLYGIKNILWIYASRESFGTHRKIYLQEVEKNKIKGFVSTVSDIGLKVNENRVVDLPKSKDCRYCAFIESCKKLGK